MTQQTAGRHPKKVCIRHLSKGFRLRLKSNCSVLLPQIPNQHAIRPQGCRLYSAREIALHRAPLWTTSQCCTSTGLDAGHRAGRQARTGQDHRKGTLRAKAGTILRAVSPLQLFAFASLANCLFLRSRGTRQFCAATSERRRGALWIHSCRVKQFAKRAMETAIRSRSDHGTRHSRQIFDRRPSHVFRGIFRRCPRRRPNCSHLPLRSGRSAEWRRPSVWHFSAQ